MVWGGWVRPSCRFLCGKAWERGFDSRPLHYSSTRKVFVAKGRYAHIRKGPALDLSDGRCYSSGWERDVARVLTYLCETGVLEGFDYEPQKFDFQGLGYRSGPMFYKPDFVVRFSEDAEIPDALKAVIPDAAPGEVVWLEVKGQETSADRSKWKRFRAVTRYKLDIIKRAEMKALMEHFSGVIPAWESRIF